MPSLDETVYDASDIAESIQQYMRCRWSRRNCPPAKPERASRATAYLLTQICASTWKPRLFRPEPDRSAGQWLARLHADTVRRRNDFGRRCLRDVGCDRYRSTYSTVARPKRHGGKRGRVTHDANSTCRDVSCGGANAVFGTTDADSSSASAHTDAANTNADAANSQPRPSDADTDTINTNAAAANAHLGACRPGCQRGRDRLSFERISASEDRGDRHRHHDQ